MGGGAGAPEVVMEPTPNSILRFAAQQIYEQTAGKAVEVAISYVGGAIGTTVGEYIGGLVGTLRQEDMAILTFIGCC